MRKIIGGSIAIILGLFCFFAFFPAFLNLLAGIIPLILILVGCLTIYLKRESESPECEEAADCWNNSAITDTPSPTAALKTAPARTEPENAEPTETETIENITDKPADDIPGLLGNTGTHVFHNPDCQYSKSKKCTIVFSTREEALLKGYKPCGTCKP